MEDDRSRPVRRTWVLVVGALYVLGAGAILLWPASVSGPFRGLLAALRSVVPYGDRLLEVFANVLLFVPAGWLAGTLLPRGRRWLAIVGGSAVSALAELIQALLLPDRVPSLRDIVANTVGVTLGVGLATIIDRRRTAKPGATPAADDPLQTAPPAEARTRRRWPVALAWLGAAVLALGIALGAWVALDALRARDALTEVVAGVGQLSDTVRDDPASAPAGLAAIQDAAGRAEAATTGPQWTVAGWLPWAGDNTRALQTITSSVRLLADDGLPGLVSAVQTVTPQQLAPQEGRIDTAPLVAVRQAVVTGDAAVGSALESIAGIDRTNLVAPVEEAVARLHGELAGVRALTSAASAATQLLPPLLGADGPRNWLLLAQNNAELRATGGAPGAGILLRAQDGRLDIVAQRSSGGFGPYPEPVLPLADAERQLFGDELGRFLQDVNLTPDFPRSAELAAAMWQQETGTAPDNVVSLDPVALATLLSATGPVEFRDPTGDRIVLTAEDAASFLMSGVYARYQRPEHQDAVFALASQAILERLTSSGTDPAALIAALTDTIGQQRLLMWSARPGEQALLKQVGVSGALQGTAPTAEGTAPRIGVFLNLTTSSKTGYYLDSTAEVVEDVAQPDGSRLLTLRVRLTSTLQPGEVDGLPEHVKWGNRDGVIRVNVLAYAPTDGTITAVGSQWRGFVVGHDGLQVSAQSVKVAAGESVDLSWAITTGPGQGADPLVRLTPGARNR